jgi:hypothetical protein
MSFATGSAGAAAASSSSSETHASFLSRMHAATLRSTVIPAAAGSARAPAAKRARGPAEDEEDDDEVMDLGTVICPPEMEPADFEKLRDLVSKHRADPFLSILPMPDAAHRAFRIPKPEPATLMDTAINAIMRPSVHAYTTTEVEVRDLSKTLTEADFPAFYTGPSHPHMIPEGGIRVISHETPRAAGEGAVGASAAAETESRSAGAAAAASKGAMDMIDD